MLNSIFKFGKQSKMEAEKQNTQLTERTTKNVCAVVEVDEFLVEYARKKYGNQKEGADNLKGVPEPQ